MLCKCFNIKNLIRLDFTVKSKMDEHFIKKCGNSTEKIHFNSSVLISPKNASNRASIIFDGIKRLFLSVLGLTAAPRYNEQRKSSVQLSPAPKCPT